jgi:hypothetical protein
MWDLIHPNTPAPPTAPRLRLKAVGALLQLSQPSTRELAAREPGLLAFRPAELRGRLDFLVERLKVGVLCGKRRGRLPRGFGGLAGLRLRLA